MTRSIVFTLALLLLSVPFVGCGGGTQFVGTWVNPDYQDQRLNDIVVIAVSDNELRRRMWETVMVSDLEAHGTHAIAMAQLLPGNHQYEEAEVKRIIAEQGANAVIVSRLLDYSKVENYVPPQTYVSGYPGYYAPYYGSYYGYYSYSYGVTTTPGYTYEDVTVTLETNLYDASSGDLIWTGQSQTFNPETADDVITPTIHMIVDELKSRGLVTKK